MASIVRSFFELWPIALIGWFGYISYNWIIKNGVGDSNSIMALATIVYAIFTFLMFRSMKNSSEAQVRPLITTMLDQNLDLKIQNKIKNTCAKNVKVRVRVIPIKEIKFDSKWFMFYQKYLCRVWTPIRDYFKSFKVNYDVFDGDKSPSLLEYLRNMFNIDEGSKDLSGSHIKISKGSLCFKLLVYVSYESLLDVDYDLYESYLVRVNNSGVRVEKNSDYH